MNSYKKELVSVRIPKPLNKKLAEYVAPMGISKNAFILQLINRELHTNLIMPSSTNLNNNKLEISTA